MCHETLLRDDVADRYAGEILAMADGPLILLFALELEDQRLLAAAVRYDRSRYARVSRVRAGPNRVAIDDRQHAPELDLAADVAGERFHFNRLARRDAILFPACFDHCVHNRFPLLVARGIRRAPEVRAFRILQRAPAAQSKSPAARFRHLLSNFPTQIYSY